MNSSVDSSMTMSDRLLMEPTFDMEEEEVIEREEDSRSNEKAIKEQEANNLDGAEVEACDRVVVVGEQKILLDCKWNCHGKASLSG